jgi:hypothetical protein
MNGAGETTILKRDALGRVSVSREQREALLDEFERSGLKGAQFARAAGMNYTTFAWWIQQRRHARGEYVQKRKRGVGSKLSMATGIRLVEAVPALAQQHEQRTSGVPTSSMQAMEVLLPGGARVLVGSASDAALAAQLINALRTPC